MRQQRGQDVVSGLRRKIGQVESEGRSPASVADPTPAEVLATMAREGFDSAALNSLPVQTLVLMASSDDLCPPSAMAGVAASLPHGALLELDGDHSLFYEQPDLWNRAVLDFLDRT